MWFEQAKGAFESENKRLNWAAFMLEQVFEFCYKCVGYVFTHYAPDEHDLFKLREIAEKYEPMLMKIFPIDKLGEKDDFDKLSRAYIGARYIKDYEVDKSDIERWRAEAEKLLAVTEKACKTKIGILKQVVDGKTRHNNI
jgi:HEPN domain-containing protein